MASIGACDLKFVIEPDVVRPLVVLELLLLILAETEPVDAVVTFGLV